MRGGAIQRGPRPRPAVSEAGRELRRRGRRRQWRSACSASRFLVDRTMSSRRSPVRILRAVCLGLIMAATGCVHPPSALRGEFPPTTVSDAQWRDASGERLRWGGEIASATPAADETCFEIVSMPLDRQAAPRRVDQTYGRFVACAPGFYDPAIYAVERKVTVVGTVDGFVDGQVGDRGYRFPRVRAETVYLWPVPPPAPAVVYDPWPYYGWGGPFWGVGGRGAWGWAGGSGHCHR